MHSLIDIFAYKIYKEKLLSHGDIRKMKYAMTVIWNELVKFVVLLIFFSLFCKVYLFLFCLCLLLPIRIFSGGLHFESGLVCFMVSICFFSLAILVLPCLFNMTINIAITLMLASVLIIYHYSPMPSRLRPILNKKRKGILKLLSLFYTLLCVFLLFKFVIAYSKVFFVSGIWTISLQALQLLLRKEVHQ